MHEPSCSARMPAGPPIERGRHTAHRQKQVARFKDWLAFGFRTDCQCTPWTPAPGGQG